MASAPVEVIVPGKSAGLGGRPAPQVAPSMGRPRARWAFLLALSSSALLYLCYFPVACGWLAWVALVPFLLLVRHPARQLWVDLAGLVCGLAFFLAALQWMRVADPRMIATWLVLTLICSLFVLLALVLLRWLDRRTVFPLTVTVPVVWTALEFVRSRFPGGFATLLLGTHQHDVPGGFGWYFLGYTQHDTLELIQVADLVGVFGVSFLIALVNGFLAECLLARLSWGGTARCSRTSLAVQGAVVLVALTGTVAYGSWRLGQGTGEPGPRLALLQGNMDQRLRNLASAADEAGMPARELIVRHYLRLAHLAAGVPTDLVVWPETSFPGYWDEDAPGVPSAESRTLGRDLTRHCGGAVLLGANSCVTGLDGRQRCYNSAILTGADGEWKGRYDKIHRVPFGEFIPLRSLFPWLNALAPYNFDYSVHPGLGFTRFPLTSGGKRYTFGTVICYEDSDPTMARPYGGGDGLPPADFVLNTSNDGWFVGTTEHDEHLAICRFRAIENRRTFARAVNTGISAVIDSNGRVLRPRHVPLRPWRDHASVDPAADPPLVWEVAAGEKEALPLACWRDFKGVAGVLIATVPVDRRASFYAVRGDLFAWGCLAVLGTCLAWVVAARLLKGHPA